jgi:hypothetical protein
MAQGMAMTNVLIWQLVAPLMPAILLLLGGALIGLCSRRDTSSDDDLLDDCDSEAFDEPLIHKAEHLLTGSSNTPSISANQSFANAVAGLCLLGYASLSQAALKFLRCQRVGDQLVLFYSGETVCPPHYSHWQTAIMLLLVAMTLVPLMPVSVWMFSQLPSS